MHSGIRMVRPPRTRSNVDAVLTKESRLLITGGHANRQRSHGHSKEGLHVKSMNDIPEVAR